MANSETALDSYRYLMNNHESDNCGLHNFDYCVKIAAVSKLPTRYGNFISVAFHQTHDNKEHIALIKGDIIGKQNVLTRIHSECLTGDAFGSLRCDCNDQLIGGVKKIERKGEGILIYLRQEGRGIGLTNKLRAYELQDKGLNTIEANHALGFSDDLREYKLAMHILNLFQIHSIRLMTNNPRKVNSLKALGISISERIEHSNLHPERPYTGS